MKHLKLGIGIVVIIIVALGAQIDQRVKESHHSGTLLVAQDGKIIINQWVRFSKQISKYPNNC